MNLLIEHVQQFVELSTDEIDILMNSFTRKSYKTRALIAEEGQYFRSHMFVLSGILRNYFVDDNLNEHTLSFASRGWWMGDMSGFLSQKRGESYIEVVMEAEVLEQTRQEQLDIFNKIPKMERFYRILIERSLIANQQRLLNNMRLPAEERYKQFCERYPDIKYKIPQKQIASYIGVTPEFFSKMKAKLLKQK